jgi:hypothetical protein
MSVREPSVELGFFFRTPQTETQRMTDAIWFELADCIGHALAKRWLARRRKPGPSAPTEPVIAANPVPDGQGLKDEAARAGARHPDSTSSK